MYFGVYMFFASLMICSAVFVFFLVPETKGVPLEKMDRLFSKAYPARKAHAIVLAEVKEEDREFRRNSLRDDTEKAEYDEAEGFSVQDNKRQMDV